MTGRRHLHRIDEYLGVIFELGEEGLPVIQARVAERLGRSRATVSEQVRRLEGYRLLAVEDRVIRLTPKGRALAAAAVRRHRIAERFLADVLGVPWHRCHEVAEDFQDGMVGEIEERIVALLNSARTCPHGNPIPGMGAPPAEARPLPGVPPGTRVTLVRLTEDIEVDTAVLRYLEEHGLLPGARITVAAVAPDGTMSLEAGRGTATLGPSLADNLWVRPPHRGRRANGRRT